MDGLVCARNVVANLRQGGQPLSWVGLDDLPFNPHHFSYEKDIINFYKRKVSLGAALYEAAEGEEETLRAADRKKLEDGCPAAWPRVVKLDFPTYEIRAAPEHQQTSFGQQRPHDAKVGAAALLDYSTHAYDLTFLEAGPREYRSFPVGAPNGILRVGVLVSGGIAPGINAVIDGIVHRHWSYSSAHNYSLQIRGFHNGLHGVLRQNHSMLFPDVEHVGANLAAGALTTSEFANQGGSMLGTHRLDELIDPVKRIHTLRQVAARLDNLDILYMIGGDGNMRAAHALWNVAAERVGSGDRIHPLSVVAIPKTMDNDILWMWQSFGFMSAVEKAREVIHTLHTEVRSNPRLCILQLFGSDSGFVVSHAVLASSAGHCDVALIPEVDFSLVGLAAHLAKVIESRSIPIPGGLIVMAETAVPVDAAYYVEPVEFPLPASVQGDDRQTAIEIGECLRLTDKERDAILEFHRMRARNERLQGQTSDYLRQASLKIVRQGLETILRKRGWKNEVDWTQLRMLTNEPRHLLRAIPPSTADIVMGQRLGALAVDNALAGYTDFMISQWLTEYVLVPLKLIVLGRKRIPSGGIFWKSVLAHTKQSADLISPWRT